jgi:hypothetical protein
MNKNAKILIFLFALSLVCLKSYCYEDRESLLKRYHLSKEIEKYSNNTLKLILSQNDGISCLANENISEDQKLMRVPKNLTLCAYYLFPFKYEILSYIMELPGSKNLINKYQTVSIYLLSYYILYYMYADKNKIKEYIKEKKLAQYYDIDNLDENFLKDYFPKEILGSEMILDEHKIELRKLGQPVEMIDELQIVFNHVNKKFLNSEHKEVVLPWISDLRQIKWAYAMIITRSFTVSLENYLNLEGLNQNKISQSQSLKKNFEVNKFISANGATCIIPFVDLINHYQPKFTNLKDIRKITLETEKASFVYYASYNYLPNKEIMHTYSKNPTNLLLLYHYGFVIPNNVFDTFSITVTDFTSLSPSQFQLCKELNCIDPNSEGIRHISSTRMYDAKFDHFDEKLINYGRVVHLDINIDKNSFLKLFLNQGMFNYENEIKAWIYYFKAFFNFDRNFSNLVERSIKDSQRMRRKLKNILKYWTGRDNTTKTKEYNRIKTYENIYLLNVYSKKIVIRHMLGSINQVIFNINKDLEKIKNKFAI